MYLRYMTGMIPAFQSAIFSKAGLAMSKWYLGGLHHPPALLGFAKLGGQRLVAVTVVMGVALLHAGAFTHLIW